MKKWGFSLFLVAASLAASPMAFAAPGFAPLRSNSGKEAFAEMLLRTCGCGTSTTGTTGTTGTTSTTTSK